MIIPAAAIAQAESTLTDTCVITRPGASSFTPGAATIGATSTPVFTGDCSASPPKSGKAVSDGADDRIVETRVIRLPHGTATVQIGDLVDVDRTDIPPLKVDQILSRTTSVLTRISCTATNDAPGVPT